MSVMLAETGEGRVLELKVGGGLHKDAYEKYVPVFERRIDEYGKIRVLFEMHDFAGWAPARSGKTSSLKSSISITSSVWRSWAIGK